MIVVPAFPATAAASFAVSLIVVPAALNPVAAPVAAVLIVVPAFSATSSAFSNPLPNTDAVALEEGSDAVF